MKPTPKDARLAKLGIKTATLSSLMRGEIPLGAEGVRAGILLDLIREARVEYREEVRISSPRAAGAYLLSRCHG
jgi:hypothetical protein